MSEPIPFHPPPRDLHNDAEERLRSASHRHAEALLSALAILQGLHDEGVLEIIRGGLGSRDKILQILVDAANSPAAVQGMRNLIILANLAGELDPNLLGTMARALPEGLTAASASAAKPIGIWGLLKRICSQDTRRALAAGVSMAESIGKALKPREA